MATVKEKVMAMAADKEYCKKLSHCSGVGETREPNCNDLLSIFVTVNDREMITDAAYEVNAGACAAVKACAAVAVKMLKNKPVLEGYTISEKMIEGLLSDNGTMDIEHIHCAIMAELSLKRAILNYAKKHHNESVT